ALSYPHLLSTEISRSTEEFYRRFYFRPRKVFAIAKEMVVDRRVMRRRLREGQEFLQFLTARRREAPGADAVQAAPRAGRTPARPTDSRAAAADHLDLAGNPGGCLLPRGPGASGGSGARVSGVSATGAFRC